MENIPFSPNEILDKTLSLPTNLYYSLPATKPSPHPSSINISWLPHPPWVTTNLTLMDLSSIVTPRKQVLVDSLETIQAHELGASLEKLELLTLWQLNFGVIAMVLP